jgi:hypothetical protein
MNHQLPFYDVPLWSPGIFWSTGGVWIAAEAFAGAACDGPAAIGPALPSAGVVLVKGVAGWAGGTTPLALADGLLSIFIKPG